MCVCAPKSLKNKIAETMSVIKFSACSLTFSIIISQFDIKENLKISWKNHGILLSVVCMNPDFPQKICLKILN